MCICSISLLVKQIQIVWNDLTIIQKCDIVTIWLRIKVKVLVPYVYKDREALKIWNDFGMIDDDVLVKAETGYCIRCFWIGEIYEKSGEVCLRKSWWTLNLVVCILLIRICIINHYADVITTLPTRSWNNFLYKRWYIRSVIPPICCPRCRLPIDARVHPIIPVWKKGVPTGEGSNIVLISYVDTHSWKTSRVTYCFHSQVRWCNWCSLRYIQWKLKSNLIRKSITPIASKSRGDISTNIQPPIIPVAIEIDSARPPIWIRGTIAVSVNAIWNIWAHTPLCWTSHASTISKKINLLRKRTYRES